MNQFDENQKVIDRHQEKLEDLDQRMSGKGIPSASDLLRKLDEMNKGMESEHAKMLKNEFANMESRVKNEVARLDLRINACEKTCRLMDRQLE